MSSKHLSTTLFEEILFVRSLCQWSLTLPLVHEACLAVETCCMRHHSLRCVIHARHVHVLFRDLIRPLLLPTVIVATKFDEFKNQSPCVCICAFSSPPSFSTMLVLFGIEDHSVYQRQSCLIQMVLFVSIGIYFVTSDELTVESVWLRCLSWQLLRLRSGAWLVFLWSSFLFITLGRRPIMDGFETTCVCLSVVPQYFAYLVYQNPMFADDFFTIRAMLSTVRCFHFLLLQWQLEDHGPNSAIHSSYICVRTRVLRREQQGVESSGACECMGMRWMFWIRASPLTYLRNMWNSLSAYHWFVHFFKVS